MRNKKRYDKGYLENKFKEVKKIEKELKSDFCTLTRLLYDEKLVKYCHVCHSREDLQIHHRRYSYPIKSRDLVRLCRKHHIEAHQKVEK